MSHHFTLVSKLDEVAELHGILARNIRKEASLISFISEHGILETSGNPSEGTQTPPLLSARVFSLFSLLWCSNIGTHTFRKLITLPSSCTFMTVERTATQGARSGTGRAPSTWRPRKEPRLGPHLLTHRESQKEGVQASFNSFY